MTLAGKRPVALAERLVLAVLVVGLALLLTVVSINLVGDHLRDVLNPRLKK